MWHLGTQFSGGLGSVRLMVGLNFNGLFQAKLFYDSVILFALFYLVCFRFPRGSEMEMALSTNPHLIRVRASYLFPLPNHCIFLCKDH